MAAQPAMEESKNDTNHNNNNEELASVSGSEFNIRAVIYHFKLSVNHPGDVDMAEYIFAYSELNKMFTVFGVLFRFVEQDVEDKNRILRLYLEDRRHGHGYRTVRTMLDFESRPDFTPPDKHTPSGSRTLLRLHRAMGFLIEFVRGVHASSHDSSMAHVCRSAYDTTLAKHHPWVVRKGVHIAVYALPTRKQLLRNLAGASLSTSVDDEEQVNDVLQEVVHRGEPIYERIQALYRERNLLNLP